MTDITGTVGPRVDDAVAGTVTPKGQGRAVPGSAGPKPTGTISGTVTSRS